MFQKNNGLIEVNAVRGNDWVIAVLDAQDVKNKSLPSGMIAYVDTQEATTQRKLQELIKKGGRYVYLFNGLYREFDVGWGIGDYQKDGNTYRLNGTIRVKISNLYAFYNRNRNVPLYLSGTQRVLLQGYILQDRVVPCLLGYLRDKLLVEIRKALDGLDDIKVSPLPVSPPNDCGYEVESCTIANVEVAE